MLKDVVLTQKKELEIKFKEKYILREVNYERFENDLIKVIIGPRRAGKSFLGINFLKRKKKFGYINFDDERLLNIDNYDELISNIDLIYENPKFLLFDEIQNLKNWELFINRLQRAGRNIIITGSNSNLLSKELATHLTGRHITIPVFPFSFSEYLKLDNNHLTEVEKQKHLEEYILYGGFPEPLIKKINLKDYLSTLFDSIIYKDIVKRYKIRFPVGIENLANYLISNIAKEFSYNKLTLVTNCKSANTVIKYTNYLSETFTFFTVSRFSYKIREQISFNKKIYCIDNGFIYSKSFQFTSNLGRLFENIVAISLKKKELNEGINFYFWKNKYNYEVDFVIKKLNKIQMLIQVCYDLNNIETLNREKRALISASKELNCKELYIINPSVRKEETFEWQDYKAKINYIPLWEWLIENK